jgi:hypothetical protein
MARIIETDRFRDKPAARGTGGSDGGNMDDVLRRLGVVESLVAETRVDVSAIKATLPHLATKADVVATKADINEVRSEINALETRIIRWIVGTTIASVSVAASVAFTIAKFVN